MNKYRVSYTAFAGETPTHGTRIVHANSPMEAMDLLEKQHPEFSTTSAKELK